MKNKAYRIEKDSLGEIKVPEHAYWGAQTQRAIRNFPVSGIMFPENFISVLGMVKMAAARVNMRLKLLDEPPGKAIEKAASEVMSGKLNGHFVTDIFQTGSGTSVNMNANEVIAGRANEILGGARGDRRPVHPNDHVNMGQSSNDVIPTCIHITALIELKKKLLPAVRNLATILEKKSGQFNHIVKIGRTHLQDAVPMRLGQEFGGYASMVNKAYERINRVLPELEELAIGGTAVGTGLNAHSRFAEMVIKDLNSETGCRFRETDNHFEAQGSRGALVMTASALKTLSVGLMKIANDIRWLGSGPRCGLGELSLPAVQPGSSIMPGKVNPVIAEALCQVCAQVIGADAAVSVAGLSGNLELNVMMPVMAHNILQSIKLLTNGMNIFAEKCLAGLEADEERCREMVEKSLALGAALAPHIGYDKAAEIVKEAYFSNRNVRDLVKEKGILPNDKLDEFFDIERMT